MARIALRCFDIPVVQLQLIGRAGVPEGAKDYIRKVCVPFQPVEGIPMLYNIDPYFRVSKRAAALSVV